MCNKTSARVIKNKLQEQHPYIEGSLTEFWKKQGVAPIPVTLCKPEERGVSWSEVINALGRRTQ
jgi:hypothetical protein